MPLSDVRQPIHRSFLAICIAFVTHTPTHAQSEWSKIAIGYSESIGKEMRLDYPQAYAITQVRASQEADLVAAGSNSYRWYYDANRILTELKIVKPSKRINDLVGQLGGILTMEAVIRAGRRFGLDTLSPDVELFFQHNRNIAQPYAAASQYILAAVDANQPTSGDDFLYEMEYQRMPFGEQLASDIINGFLNRAYESQVTNLICHEWEKVATSTRRDGWVAIRNLILDHKPSAQTQKRDFEIAIPWTANQEPSELVVCNVSDHSIHDVTVVIENTEASTLVGQHIAIWNRGESYVLRIGQSIQIRPPAPIEPRPHRASTPIHVVIADSQGPVIANQLTARPGSRFSCEVVGRQEIILEDSPLVLSPADISKRVKSAITSHNQVIAETKKAIRSEHSRIRKAKRTLPRGALEKLEADNKLITASELPITFHQDRVQSVREKQLLLNETLSDCQDNASCFGFEELASKIKSIQDALSSSKPLAIQTITLEAPINVPSSPLYTARKHLETLVHLFEQRLQAIGKKLTGTIERTRDEVQRAKLIAELRALRRDTLLPESLAATEQPFFADLDLKFRTALDELQASLPASDEQLRNSIFQVKAEYHQRYKNLILAPAHRARANR